MTHFCPSTCSDGGKMTHFSPTTVQAQCNGGIQCKRAYFYPTTLQVQCSGGRTMTRFCPSTCSDGGKMMLFCPPTLQAQGGGIRKMTHFCPPTPQTHGGGISKMTHFCPTTPQTHGAGSSKMTHFRPTTLQSTRWRQQQYDTLLSNNSAKHKVAVAARRCSPGRVLAAFFTFLTAVVKRSGLQPSAVLC